MSHKIKKEKSKFIEKKDAIIAFKGFKKYKKNYDPLRPEAPGLYCRNMEYEEGNTYVNDGDIEACGNGFHCCRTLNQVFKHYDLKSGHAFHKVKVWGIIDEQDDKIAASHMTVCEPLSQGEIRWQILADKLPSVDRAIERNPNLILSGSLALLIYGLLPMRKMKDLDFCLQQWSDFEDCDINKLFGGKSGSETIMVKINDRETLKPLNEETSTGFGFSELKASEPHFDKDFDVWIQPDVIYKNVTLAGKKYKIALPFYIYQAKNRYFLNGNIKHGKDLSYLYRVMGDWHDDVLKSVATLPEKFLNFNGVLPCIEEKKYFGSYSDVLSAMYREYHQTENGKSEWPF